MGGIVYRTVTGDLRRTKTSGYGTRRRAFVSRSLLLVACVLALAACRPDPPHRAPPPARTPLAPGRVLTLGDIDSETPAFKLERIEPLANHLEPVLDAAGIDDVRVVIARDIDEMAAFLEAGEVDVYFDSVYPTLAVGRRTPTRIVVRAWVRESFEYRGLLVARRSSGITELMHLAGRVIAFEEAHSTSGYFLPNIYLQQRGLTLQHPGTPRGPPAAGAVGYVFSGDAENTVELVIRGTVDAGAISDEDFDALPAEVRDELTVIGRTETVPRRLVSVRADLDADVVAALRKGLLAVAEDGPVTLEEGSRAWTWKFEEIGAEMRATIEGLAPLLEELE